MLKQKIADRIYRPARNRDGGDFLFSLFESLYGLGQGLKNRHLEKSEKKRLPVPVISVGNVVAGGTGKTPMTAALARILADEGFRVAVLSRGYGGKLVKKGGRVSDGKEVFLKADMAGDEPCLLAATTPASVYVGADRYRSGLRAVEEGAEILLLDDGFQHRILHRDLDIVLLDSQQPFGNGRLLPRGSLRERPSSLLRAHALVFTRWEGGEFRHEGLCQWAEAAGIPVFFSRHEQLAMGGEAPLPLSSEKVLAFSALADGRSFVDGLLKKGWNVGGVLKFPDHHPYGPSAMEPLVEKARRMGAKALITTAKDAVKLPDASLWPLPLHVVDVRMDFLNPSAFTHWLKGELDKILRVEK
ncbi:lipid-A-disaccharide kinase [Desulfobotulus alkaliphilus]|uniref:Tetraacyldisaccharide 4'-kinase n=1 Tax=Desulfobotulus alkaliphilus TaxID=622671 RepID=A0A562R6Z1_9BACT|nr:tetraacyldisaccharide 4'-kinase [Desulfobotulus alkaliphilus]TWI64815.1 lipid-A-disaccharide kinase [Desulfobotulus alkaliphilus]